MYAIILRDTDSTADAVFYGLTNNRDEAFHQARQVVRTDKVAITGWAEVQEIDGDHFGTAYYAYSIQQTWSIPKPVAFNAAGTCPLDDNNDYLK